MKIEGWVFVDKKTGDTSMATTTFVRRLYQAKRGGHAGTLDPLASGILPIALGSTTRLIPFLMEEKKSYDFTVAWGEATSTYDSLGTVVATSSVYPSHGELSAILPHFCGLQKQVPPVYSAVKVQGKPAYKRARQGEDFVLGPRLVTIHRLILREWKPKEASFSMDCSSGTYVRTLAADLASILGTYGHVTCLRRTSVGSFCEGISLDSLEKKAYKERVNFLNPPSTVLGSMPSYILCESEKIRLWRGQVVPLFSSLPEGLVACYDYLHQLAALALSKGGKLIPKQCFIGEI